MTGGQHQRPNSRELTDVFAGFGEDSDGSDSVQEQTHAQYEVVQEEEERPTSPASDASDLYMESALASAALNKSIATASKIALHCKQYGRHLHLKDVLHQRNSDKAARRGQPRPRSTQHGQQWRTPPQSVKQRTAPRSPVTGPVSTVRGGRLHRVVPASPVVVTTKRSPGGARATSSRSRTRAQGEGGRGLSRVGTAERSMRTMIHRTYLEQDDGASKGYGVELRRGGDVITSTAPVGEAEAGAMRASHSAPFGGDMSRNASPTARRRSGVRRRQGGSPTSMGGRSTGLDRASLSGTGVTAGSTAPPGAMVSLRPKRTQPVWTSMSMQQRQAMEDAAAARQLEADEAARKEAREALRWGASTRHLQLR